MMRAWQVTEWCEPEQMALTEVAIPNPGPGEVRLRNHAAALNFFDILLVQGNYQVRPPFPFTPGAEVAGVVDAVGDGVTGLAVGDRVLAMLSNGGYAEYSIAPAARTFRLPERMTFIQAAAMPIVYQTSIFALKHRGEIRAGEWLLVLAAAGGVGSSAVQLGKAMGAKVIAAVGSESKFPFCHQLGADEVITYGREGWTDEVRRMTGTGANLIYDPVGADYFDQATKCIAPEGRILIIGFAAGRIPTIAANRLLLKNASAVGVYWGGYVEKNPGYLAAAQAELFALYDAGGINPIVTSTAPLADAPVLLRSLANRQVSGKAVLIID